MEGMDVVADGPPSAGFQDDRCLLPVQEGQENGGDGELDIKDIITETEHDSRVKRKLNHHRNRTRFTCEKEVNHHRNRTRFTREKKSESSQKPNQMYL